MNGGGHGEENPIRPPHGESEGEEKITEERGIIEATETVLPRERIEQLAEAAQRYGTEIQNLDLLQGAQSELARMETRGRLALAAGAPPPPNPAQPAAPVLQRRLGFREASRRATSTAPQIPDHLDRARVNNGRDELLAFRDDIVASAQTRAEGEKALATYGSSVEELFSEVFAVAGGPGVSDVQTRVLKVLGAARLAGLRETLIKLQSVARTSPVDLVLLGATAQDLMAGLKEIRDQLANNEEGLLLGDMGAQIAALAAVAGFTGELLKTLLNGQPVQMRNPSARGIDLGGRLRFLGELPCAARADALRESQRDLNTNSARFRKEVEAQARRKADLAAIPAGTDPIREQKLKSDIQDGETALDQMAKRFGAAAETVTSRFKELAPVSEAIGAAYDRLIRNGSTGNEWSRAVKEVLRALQDPKTTLDPQQRADAVEVLRALDGTLDADLVRLVDRLSGVTKGATPTELEALVNDAWEYTARLGRVMNEIGRRLAGAPPTAAVFDPLRVRLQTTLAALSSFLAQRVLIAIRV